MQADNLAILKTTCAIYAIVFLGAGLMTFAFRKTNWGRNIVAAIIMWFVIFVLFMFGAYLGWYPFAVLILFISIVAVREFYKMNNVCGTPQLAISAIALLLMALAIRYSQYELFNAVPLMAVFLFFCGTAFSWIMQGHYTDRGYAGAGVGLLGMVTHAFPSFA